MAVEIKAPVGIIFHKDGIHTGLIEDDIVWNQTNGHGFKTGRGVIHSTFNNNGEMAWLGTNKVPFSIDNDLYWKSIAGKSLPGVPSKGYFVYFDPENPIIQEMVNLEGTRQYQQMIQERDYYKDLATEWQARAKEIASDFENFRLQLHEATGRGKAAATGAQPSISMKELANVISGTKEQHME